MSLWGLAGSLGGTTTLWGDSLAPWGEWGCGVALGPHRGCGAAPGPYRGCRVALWLGWGSLWDMSVAPQGAMECPTSLWGVCLSLWGLWGSLGSPMGAIGCHREGLRGVCLSL